MRAGNEFVTQTPVTDPGELRDWVLGDGLSPADVPEFVRALVVHMDRAPQATETRRREEPAILTVADMLRRLHELDPTPPSLSRPPEARLIGHCRTTSVLGCGLFRELGVPSRVRVGYAAYYAEGRAFFGNHWVIEVWDEVLDRWRLVDAELDAQTCAQHNIRFDPNDVPLDHFILAGHAWLDCRTGAADWQTFGPYPDQTGVTEVAAQLLRDAASLAGHEVGPFDTWAPPQLSAEQMTVLNELATATVTASSPNSDGDDRCRQLRERHSWLQTHERF
jgi:Transglutaminase-like superfamily